MRVTLALLVVACFLLLPDPGFSANFSYVTCNVSEPLHLMHTDAANVEVFW